MDMLTHSGTQTIKTERLILRRFAYSDDDSMLKYWISDPENGSDGLKSLINLEILRLLRAHHIEIPFPQRVVHRASVEKVPSLPL